jgi:hypothetical protein
MRSRQPEGLDFHNRRSPTCGLRKKIVLLRKIVKYKFTAVVEEDKELANKALILQGKI